MFVNAGGEALNEADSNIKVSRDTCYEGGNVLRTNEQITDGGDYPFIYQSARLGNFCYRFNDLSPGEYYIDFHFTEIINTNGPKGLRIFNVFVQEEKASFQAKCMYLSTLFFLFIYLWGGKRGIRDGSIDFLLTEYCRFYQILTFLLLLEPINHCN